MYSLLQLTSCSYENIFHVYFEFISFESASDRQTDRESDRPYREYVSTIFFTGIARWRAENNEET